MNQSELAIGHPYVAKSSPLWFGVYAKPLKPRPPIGR